VLAAFLFGVTFVIVKDAVQDVTPAAFITFRFALGTVVLAPFAVVSHRRASVRVDRATLLRAALPLGLVLCAGYFFQTVGLQYTSVSSSAFITGLFVVFTPLIEVGLRRRGLGPVTATAVVLAGIGLFFITGARPSLGEGEALTLGCAVTFAVQIVMLGVWAPRFHPLTLNTAQMAVLAVVSVPAVLVTGVGTLTARAIVAIAVTGVLCSAVAFTLQVRGQARVGATRSALVLSFEPVFAAATGYAVGKGLGALSALGATLILVAVIVEEGGATWLEGRRARRS